MQLTKSTIDILKNFAAINSNLWFTEGNEIKTRSVNKTIGAYARVDVEFPKEFGIWDMNQMMNIITTLFDEPPYLDFDQFQDGVVIKDDTKNIVYRFAQQETLEIADKPRPKFESKVDFCIAKEELVGITKASQIMKMTHLSVESNGDDFFAELYNPDLPLSNTYRLGLGDSDGAVFKMNFKMEEIMRLDSDAYRINLAEKTISSFESQSRDLTYFVVMLPDSEYKG